jgi:galactitol-specific phosphotransferase system IIB component
MSIGRRGDLNFDYMAACGRSVASSMVMEPKHHSFWRSDQQKIFDCAVGQ